MSYIIDQSIIERLSGNMFNILPQAVTIKSDHNSFSLFHLIILLTFSVMDLIENIFILAALSLSSCSDDSVDEVTLDNQDEVCKQNQN